MSGSARGEAATWLYHDDRAGGCSLGGGAVSGPCPNCGAATPDGASFCPTCGSRLAADTVALRYVTGHASPSGGLVAGQLLGGRYRLEAPVASGAMGTVWRARDERLHGRPCAVKAIRLDSVAPQER